MLWIKLKFLRKFFLTSEFKNSVILQSQESIIWAFLILYNLNECNIKSILYQTLGVFDQRNMSKNVLTI